MEMEFGGTTLSLRGFHLCQFFFNIDEHFDSIEIAIFFFGGKLDTIRLIEKKSIFKARSTMHRIVKRQINGS